VRAGRRRWAARRTFSQLLTRHDDEEYSRHHILRRTNDTFARSRSALIFMSTRALSRLVRASSRAHQTRCPEPVSFVSRLGVSNATPRTSFLNSNSLGAPRHESSNAAARARKLEDDQVRNASTGLTGRKREADANTEETEVSAKRVSTQSFAGTVPDGARIPGGDGRPETTAPSVPNPLSHQRRVSNRTAETGWDANSEDSAFGTFGRAYPSSVVYVDTLETVRKLERAGMDAGAAEVVAREIATAAKLATAPLSSRSEFEKLQIAVSSQLHSVEGEMKSRQREAESSSRHAVTTVTSELEKLRAELRFAHDKITTSQKLDLNLERGRLRDDLQRQDDKTNSMELRLDREISSMKTTIEAAKNDVIKYSIGAIMSMAAVGMSLMRLMM